MDIYYYTNIIFFCLKIKNKHGWPRYSSISITLAFKLKKWSQLKLHYLSYRYLKYRHVWMHMKNMLPLTTINHGSKATSKKTCVVLFSMEPSPLLQNIEWKYSEIKEWQSIEVPAAKLQEFFGPILSKNIKFSNAHKCGNTGPILKIPTSLSSEAWDLSPYKISWILVEVRWKIPILLDHLTWNDP